MKTKCLIIDDEPLAIKIIETYICKIPNLKIVSKCSNALEAFDVILNNNIDLIFLDVEMPEISGLDLLKSLKKAPAIIFTTAFRDFALDAYELDAIDYLLKPISFERFFKSVSKYYQWKSNDNLKVLANRKSEPTVNGFINIRSDRKVVKLFIDDISFIESLNDYVKIHLEDEIIITREKISVLENILPEDQFIRTHRSFIISVGKIKAFTSETIEIKKCEIPIGRTYKSSVLSFLGYHEL